MHKDDWRRFSSWLLNIETEVIMTFDQLILMYENSNPKIQWNKKARYEYLAFT